MASVRQDKVQVVLEIASNQAKTELDNLSRKAQLLDKELKGMKKGTQEYAATWKELQQVNEQIDASRQKLGLTGMSYKQLEKEAKDLKRDLGGLTEGTEQFVAKSKRLQEVEARAKEVKNAMHGIKTEIDNSGNGFSGFLKKAVAFSGIQMGVEALVRGVISYGREAVTAYGEAAAAEAQLDASLASTQNAAGLTKKELVDMAQAIKGKTLFDDDAVLQAESLLLTFTDIKKGVFEEALPAIGDLATKMAGDGPADLKGATIQVGKALNDPIKGITALSRVGVSFTEEQKATIKTLVDMGDKAGAQKIILAELNKEFGGSAEAARKAGTGGFKAFMITMGDLKESVGEKLTQGLDKASNFLGQLMDKADPLVQVFSAFWATVTGLWSDINLLVTGLFGLNEEGSAAEFVIDALTTVFTLFLAPMKIAYQVVRELIGGFIRLYNSSEVLRGVIGGLGAIVVHTFTTIKEAALTILDGVGDLLIGIFTLDVDKIQAGLEKSFAGVAKTTEVIGVKAALAFQEGYNKQKDKLIDTEPTVAEVKAAETKGKKKGEKEAQAESEAHKKEREKREKEEQDAAQKIADLKVAITIDEYERKQLTLRMAAEREKANAKGSATQIAEQRRLIDQKLQQDLADLENARIDESVADAKIAADKKAEITKRAAQAASEYQLLIAKKSDDPAVLFQAQQSLLDQKLQQELANANLTAEEKLLIQEQYEQSSAALAKTYRDAKFQEEIDGYKRTQQAVQTGYQIISDFQKILSDRQINKEEQEKQRRIKALDQEFKQGRISKEAYERAKEGIEADSDGRIKAAKRKAANDEKQLKIAESIITGTLAVLAASANPLGFLSPTAIATAIAAAAATAKIAATPLPTFGKGGIWGAAKRMFRNGARINPVAGVPDAGQLHSNGGIQMVDGATGQHLGEWERGEPYMILSRNTYANNKDVVDQLIDTSLHRGGAPIRAERGGIYAADGTLTGPAPNVGGAAGQDYQVLIAEVRGVRAAIERMPTVLRAYIDLSDLEDGLEEREAVRSEAAA